MKIAVWKTGHEIADTVANSLENGSKKPQITELTLCDTRYHVRHSYGGTDAAIGYGILRGIDDVFKDHDKQNKRWFELDRGYFNPSHYDGYYRISYKGTQAKYDPTFPITKEFDSELEPIRKDDKSKSILVCPPTNAVCEFFGMKMWYDPLLAGKNFIWREKGNSNSINWDDYRAVITFNSSIGWQALQRGIPCLSNTPHSVVGSYYNTKSIDEAIEMFNTKPRKPLFDFMRSHQFTLAEIEQGKAWTLIKHYLSISDGTHGKQSVPMSAPTPSKNALKHQFQSNI